MGSFNATCSISGLPIRCGDDVAFFILLKNKYFNIAEPTDLICDNNSPFALFNIFSLPIYGKYDDYGRIDNIIKDETTNKLELFFNLTIEEILAGVHDDRDRKKTSENYDILTSLYGTFIRKDIYDELSCVENNNIGDSYITIDLLKELGFKIINEDSKEERYKYILTHESSNELYIKSDGNWSHIIKDDKEISSIYKIKDFIRGWFKLTNFKLEYDINRSKFDYNIDLIYNQIKELKDKFTIENEDIDYSKDYIFNYKLKDIYYSKFNFPDVGISTKELKVSYGVGMLSYLYDLDLNSIRTELVKCCHFINSMYELNKIFFPSIYGGQEYQYTILKKLNDKVSNILKEYKENDDNNDDYSYDPIDNI